MSFDVNVLAGPPMDTTYLMQTICAFGPGSDIRSVTMEVESPKVKTFNLGLSTFDLSPCRARHGSARWIATGTAPGTP
jgi:hypothetical protein